MPGIDISDGAGLCSMMKCGLEASHHVVVRHVRDSSESHLWACAEHIEQVEQFARNIVNGPGLEFFPQLAPRSFRLVILSEEQGREEYSPPN